MYQEFKDKLESLQAAYRLKVNVMWQHEWTALRKSDPRVGAFLSSFDTPEPLETRQALQPDETIGYVDFTSLYPHVMSSSCYSLGNPEIIHSDFDLPQNYFGLSKQLSTLLGVCLYQCCLSRKTFLSPLSHLQ
jgi:hypothetical protein